MLQREVSLYYATLGGREAAKLISAWLASPIVAADVQRARLAKAVKAHLPATEVFAYSTGRGALAAFLQAAGIGPGDDVLLSSFTCLAVPTAVLAAGARPVYADINPCSLNTPAATIVAALRQPVRAVVVQHTLGGAAEIEAIALAARAKGILVIEDCALACGARHNGRLLGSFGDAAIWSMELSKTITTGWGGVLAVHEPSLANRVAKHYATIPEPPASRNARQMWQAAVTGFCYQPAIHRMGKYVVAAAFRMGLFGPSTAPDEAEGRPRHDFITRLGGPQAALGALQWARLDSIAARSQYNASFLRDALQAVGLKPLAAPAPQDSSVTPRVPFLVADRSAACRWFQSRGIELGSWFDGPLSPPPSNPELFNYQAGRYTHAEFIARHIVNLPSHSRLTSDDLSNMAGILSSYADAHPADHLVPAALAC